jgi:hypothetical protein
MTTIATLAVKLTGDVSNFTDSMDRAESKARASAVIIGGLMQEIGAAMVGMGTKLTTFVTLPIIAGGVAAVNYASDLEETKNKAEVVFGDMAQAVLDWSSTSATALGQSQDQALAAAATYGNLFVTMGLGQAPAAEMSMSLVELAADLASFNNANPADVLAAMQSGLVGQVEPLRKYGVVLSEAAVQAKALELGLIADGEELSEAAKLQARYAIVLEQTTTAQGDFARTSEGLANKTRIVKAQLADAGAKIGALLLPYVLKAANFVSSLMEKFDALSPSAKKMILIIIGIAAVIGPLLVVVGTLVTAIGAIIPVVTAVAGAISFPLIAIIAAVIGIIALLVAAWKNNWGGIRDKLMEVWAQIQPVLQMVWDWLATNIPLAIQAVSDWWTTVFLPAIQTAWAWVQANVFPIIQTLVNIYIAYLIAYVQALADIWTTYLLPAIQAVWDFVANTLWPLISAVANFLGAVFGLVLTALAAIWTNILLPAITAVWNFIVTYIWPLFQAIANFISAVFNLALTALAGLWQNVLQPAIQTVYEWIADKLQPIFEALAAFWENTVLPLIQTLGEWLDEKLSPAFETLGGWIQNITDWFNDLADMINNLKLPAWLTPGSPTPLEIGLIGIDKAMAMLNRTELPRFSTRLSVLPGEMPVMSGLDGMMRASNQSAVLQVGGAASERVTVVVPFQYSPMMSLADEYEAETVIGPIIERRVRQAMGVS